MSVYNREYAIRYIERTLGSPYTKYKNQQLAEILSDLGANQVWDLGGNVSGLMKVEGSLRLQLEKRGASYRSVDLVPEYFSSAVAHSLGRPDSEIYGSVEGIVGDLRALPLADGQLESIVCADVIEHISEPELAISEMYRVLKPGGHTILVVPSLYKLDSIKLPHILNKRFSSHENRLVVDEWLHLLTEAGFKVEKKHSRPLGIASGLLYLTWLNPDYVPSRPGVEDEEEYSQNAQKFRRIKSLISSLDNQIDALVLSDPKNLDLCRELLSEGDVMGILNLIENWYLQVVGQPNQELSQFVENFDFGRTSLEGMDRLSSTIVNSSRAIKSDAFFGNSALLVLSK